MATIKKIILLALIALMMVGCNMKTQDKIEEPDPLKGFNIDVIDSCEYLIKYDTYHHGYGFMAHKGDCSFCKERRKKELEELIIKLKEK